MKNLFKEINNILVSDAFSSKIVEKFLILISFWWSLILLLPVSTFDSSIAYNPMAIIAEEYVWGIFFLILGITHIAGLNSIKIRSYALLTSTVTWLFVGTMMFIGLQISTATGTYFLVAYLSATLYVKNGLRG